MSKMKIRKGDEVKVIAGKYKGTEGKVLAVDVDNNKVKVEEVIYTWCTGYYSRLNKTPFECELDRDDLCSSHSPACQGKKKTFNWRQN